MHYVKYQIMYEVVSSQLQNYKKEVVTKETIYYFSKLSGFPQSFYNERGRKKESIEWLLF